MMTAPIADASAMDIYLEELDAIGYTVIPDILEPGECADLRGRIDSLFEDDLQRFGYDELVARRELGTIRCPMVRDERFLEVLSHPRVLSYVERILGPTCILHLQNCIVLSPSKHHQQSDYHQDYRPWVNGAAISVNAFLLIDDFTEVNGGTFVVPGTHKIDWRPSKAFLDKHARIITGSAGSMLLFHSRLWHRGGENLSENRRRAINHQYTLAFIRQQIDYARAFPEEAYAGMPERVQQLLGRFVRAPKNAEEFRLPADRRLHRSGQY